MANKKKILEIIAPALLLTDLVGLGRLNDSVKLAIVVAYIFYGFRRCYFKTSFDKALLTMFCGLCLSMVSCLVFRDQSLIQSMVVLWNFWSIGLYYYYLRQRYDSDDMLSALTILGKLVLLIYLVRYLLLQYGLYSFDHGIDGGEAELVRMRINCSASVFFLYFRYLQSYLQGGKWFNLVWLLLVVFVSLLMNFRTILAGLIVFSLLEIWMARISKTRLVLMGVVCLLAGLWAFNSELVNHKLDQLQEKIEKGENFNNKDYIRIAEFDYYVYQHHENIVEQILGSGMPYFGSKYGAYMEKVLQSLRLFYADWGLIGISWILGILTVIGIVWYVVVAARSKIDDTSVIVWFLFLLTVSIITYELPRNGNFLVQAMAMAYITKKREEIYLSVEQEKNNENDTHG